MVAWALAQTGRPYRFGATGPTAFDCSGLTQAAYARVGIRLEHQTGGQRHAGRAVSRGELQPGDLVFPSAGHVGIYVGGGMMVHASNPRGGVKYSRVYAFVFARRLVG